MKAKSLSSAWGPDALWAAVARARRARGDIDGARQATRCAVAVRTMSELRGAQQRRRTDVFERAARQRLAQMGRA
jgi:hypothetical protein